MPVAISMRDLSKRYLVEEDRASTLKEAVLRLFRHAVRHEIEAVRPLTLDIMQGETLGIVGQNGAGKSTLLRLISGVTTPTSGSVEVNGSLMSLLELGAGFQPDLSGVDNVFLNGSVLGLTDARIAELLPSIVEFSGLKKFIYTPVKHYSSGMTMRLGFAIAAHIEPDIVVLDENMAVGDICFQAKCVAKMRELKRKRKTIVLVTHALDVAEALCDRIAWLDHGNALYIGEPEMAIKRYEGFLAGEVIHEYTLKVHEELAEAFARGGENAVGRFGSGDAAIRDFSIVDAQGRGRHVFTEGEPLTATVAFEAKRLIPNLALTLYVRREDGVQIFALNSVLDGMKISAPEGPGFFRVDLGENLLTPGRYIVTVALGPDDDPLANFDLHLQLYHFRVEPRFPAQLTSMVRLPFEAALRPVI